MKSNSWVVVELGAGLLLAMGLSFFVSPAYEKGVWLILGALVMAFGNAMGTKSGAAMPAQAGDVKPGQDSKSTTTVETQSANVDDTAKDA